MWYARELASTNIQARGKLYLMEEKDMKLSELRSEMRAWAAWFGPEFDPEVFVRVRDSQERLTSMEIGDRKRFDTIVLGSWQAGHFLDADENATSPTCDASWC